MNGICPPYFSVVDMPALLEEPVDVEIYGGVSGIARGQLMGALANYGAGRRWQNSWMLIPSGVVGHGDSGAPVLTSRRMAIGMVVSGIFDYRRREEVVCLVQDLRSLEEEWLFPRDIHLTIS